MDYSTQLETLLPLAIEQPCVRGGALRRETAGVGGAASVGADVDSRPGTHSFLSANERFRAGYVACFGNADSVIIAFALMAYGEDRHRLIVVDFEQRNISRCAKRNNQFPQKWH